MTQLEGDNRLPQYAGTSLRPPCCACNGLGWELRYVSGEGLKAMCVVCSGTRVQPRTSSEGAARRAGRVAAMRRNARRR